MTASQLPGAATTPRWLLPLVQAVSIFYLFLLLWLVAIVVVGAVVMRLDPVVVSSGSMLPRINVGDVVLLQPDPQELGPGAVITFEDPARPGGLVTHRIEDVNPDGTLVTKGDANRVADSSPVASDVVEGAGRLLVPMVGLPVMWAQQGAWLEVSIWLAVTAAALFGATTRDRPVTGGHEGLRSRVQTFADSKDAPAAIIGTCALVLLVAGTSLVWQDTASAFTGSSPSRDNDFAAATLTAPTNVSATFDCGLRGVGSGIVVDWDAVTDADSYQVHRSITSGGPYTLIATVDAGSTSYKDTDVANNTTYYYVIRTTYRSWSSNYSAEASGTSRVRPGGC